MLGSGRLGSWRSRRRFAFSAERCRQALAVRFAQRPSSSDKRTRPSPSPELCPALRGERFRVCIESRRRRPCLRASTPATTLRRCCRALIPTTLCALPLDSVAVLLLQTNGAGPDPSARPALQTPNWTGPRRPRATVWCLTRRPGHRRLWHRVAHSSATGRRHRHPPSPTPHLSLRGPPFPSPGPPLPVGLPSLSPRAMHACPGAGDERPGSKLDPGHRPHPTPCKPHQPPPAVTGTDRTKAISTAPSYPLAVLDLEISG